MRNFINKILNVPKLILRIWILLWVLLVILLIMKFCFGIWYPIASNNQIFNDVCNFIDDRDWLYKIISFILYFISGNIISLTYMGQKKYRNLLTLIIVNIFIISCGIIKIFNSVAGNVYEILFFIIGFPIINLVQNNFDKKWKNILVPIIVYIIFSLWQLSIYLVRGLNMNELKDFPILIPLILMFDYYIFVFIMWIGVSYMSWFSFGWLFSKDITVLKAHRGEEVAKANPDLNLIAEIDAKIQKLEKEGK